MKIAMDASSIIVTQLIHDLASNIKSQVAVHERMIESARMQNSALAAGDGANVELYGQELDMAMVERGIMEHRRQVIVETLALELDTPVEDLDRQRLAAMLGPESAAEINALAQRLMLLATQLREEVQRGQQLVRREIGFIDGMVRFVASSGRGLSQYTRSAASANVNTRPVLINRQA